MTMIMAQIAVFGSKKKKQFSKNVDPNFINVWKLNLNQPNKERFKISLQFLWKVNKYTLIVF